MTKVEVGVRRIRELQTVELAWRILTHAKGRAAHGITALLSLGGLRRADPTDMF